MAMKKRRKQVRGENRISGALNKPIGGELGKKRSAAFVAIFAVVGMAGLAWFAISELGFKAGMVVTLIAFGTVVYTVYEQRFIQRHFGNRKWKAFDKDE